MDANELFFKSIPVGLVVSLPRSETSWVGEILGNAKKHSILEGPIISTPCKNIFCAFELSFYNTRED